MKVRSSRARLLQEVFAPTSNLVQHRAAVLTPCLLQVRPLNAEQPPFRRRFIVAQASCSLHTAIIIVATVIVTIPDPSAGLASSAPALHTQSEDSFNPHTHGFGSMDAGQAWPQPGSSSRDALAGTTENVHNSKQFLRRRSSIGLGVGARDQFVKAAQAEEAKSAQRTGKTVGISASRETRRRPCPPPKLDGRVLVASTRRWRGIHPRTPCFRAKVHAS